MSTFTVKVKSNVSQKLKTIDARQRTEAKKTLNKIGRDLVNKMKQGITKGPKSGRLYRRGRKFHRAHPLVNFRLLIQIPYGETSFMM